MADQDKPKSEADWKDPAKTIQVNPERAFCLRHGAPFKETWPKGYIPWFMPLIHEWLNRAETAAEIGEATVEAINKALEKIPLCCRVKAYDPERLVQAYVSCGVGKMGRCSVCKAMGMGAPYTAINPETIKPHRYSHVCFPCVVSA